MMMKLYCFLLLFWAVNAADNFTCYLCPGGADPATPDRVYKLGDSATSCRDVMNTAATATADSCTGTVTWSNSFDWPAFCGCPGFNEQYICGDFCWDNKVAYAPLPSDIAQNANCQDFAGYYGYLLDKTKCGGNTLKAACCVNVVASASSNPCSFLVLATLLGLSSFTLFG
jgi:hypothetical protein